MYIKFRMNRLKIVDLYKACVTYTKHLFFYKEMEAKQIKCDGFSNNQLKSQAKSHIRKFTDELL